MKILLVNLYPSDTFARYLLSSYVLKVYLEKNLTKYQGLTIDIINLSSSTLVKRICKIIQDHKPDVIGYSSYIWNIGKVIESIKCLKLEMKVVHILGGPEIALDNIGKLARNGIGDYYVIGEGEIKFTNLIEYLLRRIDGEQVDFPKGIAYWDEKLEELKYTEDSSGVLLNNIPSIYLEGTIEDKLYKGGQVFVETQRGCKYKCKYCVYHKNLSRISYYPIQRIYNELDYLIIEKQVSALRFIDATFTSDLNHAKSIARHLYELKLKGINLPWVYWEFNYDSTDNDFLKIISLLKNSEKVINSETIEPLNKPQLYSDMLKNYTVINCIGIQSFNSETLRSVARPPIKTDVLSDFLKTCKSFNLVLKIDLIMGLPFETLETYINGLEFFLPFFEGTDNILNIHFLQILPGSQLEKLCGSYSITYSEHAPHVVYSTNGMTKEELSYASKITAVLFRIVNSPLRKNLFCYKAKTGYSFTKIAEMILNKLANSAEYKNSILVKNDCVDDEYWNHQIFYNIPSEWIRNYLQQ